MPIQQTKALRRSAPHRQKCYKKISHASRIQIIYDHLVHNVGLVKLSKREGIRYNTIRNIILAYQDDGRTNKKTYPHISSKAHLQKELSKTVDDTNFEESDDGTISEKPAKYQQEKCAFVKIQIPVKKENDKQKRINGTWFRQRAASLYLSEDIIPASSKVDPSDLGRLQTFSKPQTSAIRIDEGAYNKLPKLKMQTRCSVLLFHNHATQLEEHCIRQPVPALQATNPSTNPIGDLWISSVQQLEKNTPSADVSKEQNVSMLHARDAILSPKQPLPYCGLSLFGGSLSYLNMNFDQRRSKNLLAYFKPNEREQAQINLKTLPVPRKIKSRRHNV